MKSRILLLLLLPSLLFLSCSSALDNSITIKNGSAESVTVNILGKVLTLKSGTSQVVKNISKGTYSYAVNYIVPSGITQSSVEGNANGSLIMTAGTEISMYFSYRIQTTTGGGSSGGLNTYIFIVTVSSSDSNTTTTGA